MTIQDLAGNYFQTASSAMIGFVPASETLTRRTQSLRIYRFLIEGIREADQTDGNRFVERFVEGPQGIWDGIDASIRSLPNMWSFTDCEDRFLPFLKWIVGWTSELDYITDELDFATLRRLIASSVPFWKVRGTEDALTEILQLTTAARTRVWDWFDLRYIADETAVGEVREGYDSWALELPGAPGFSENQMNVRIVDDGTLNRRLVRNLVRLTRPAGERITISYLGFLDLFSTDDDSSQWTSSSGGPSPTVEGGTMSIGDTDSVYANPDAASSWRNYVVSVTFSGGPYLLLQAYRSSDGDCYLIFFQGSQVSVYSFSGAVLSPVADAITYIPDYPVLPDFIGVDSWQIFGAELTHTLRVQLTDEAGVTRIAVWLNGNLLISVLDSSHTQGGIGFTGALVPGNTVQIHEVEMYFVPMEEDIIDIQGASGVVEEELPD